MAINKLRALEYLVAVVEQGGFAAAGRRLGVSAPSVHRMVTALEAELGLALVDRARTPLRATTDAARYVDRARTLVGELRDLDLNLRDRDRKPAGIVNIAAQSVCIRYFITPALPELHQRFPEIRIDLRDAGTERDLTQMDADLLVTFGWPPAQESVIRTLAHTRWLVVASPAFWKRFGKPEHPAELERLPCALYRTPYGEVVKDWVFTRGRERVTVRTDGWIVGDDRGALDAPILAGQMAGRFNDLTLLDGLRNGTLQPVLLDWVGQHSPPLYVLIRKAATRYPRVRAVVEFLAARADELAASRIPVGLPPVHASRPPDWFKRRVR